MALSPLPTPRIVRPGAISEMVRAAAAVTLGCRVSKVVTHEPTRMLRVSRAATARVAQTSRHRNCESGYQAMSKPASSAARAAAPAARRSAHGGMRIPKTGACELTWTGRSLEAAHLKR